MGNRNIKLITLALIMLTIILVSTNNTIAYGISMPYWKDNPLKMYPGQIKEVALNLQNCPSKSEEKCQQEDVDIIVSLEEGKEIAELTSGTSYTIPFGTADTYIILKVIIPENAEIGSTYNIKLFIMSVPKKTISNIQLGIGYNKEFPVKIVEESEAQTEEDVEKETEITLIDKEEKNVNTALLIGIFILLIMAVAIAYWMFKRKI